LDNLPQTPIESVDLGSLIDLPPLESLPSGEKSRWDAMMEELSKTDLTPKPSLGEAALPEEWETETPATGMIEQAETPDKEPAKEAPSVDQPSEQPPAPSILVTSDELPQIITADMLRARRAQRKAIDFNDKDFEIPAELLAGYDEDIEDEPEIEEDDAPAVGSRGKEKPKGKKAVGAAKPDKRPKKQKKWRPARPEDDLDDLY
jgi:hypothetical protein